MSEVAHDERSVAVIATGADAERVAGLGLACVRVVASVEDAPDDLAIVVIGDPATGAVDPRVAYVARPGIPDDQLRQLIAGIASGRAAPVVERAVVRDDRRPRGRCRDGADQLPGGRR
jgi:hypothetical protein